MVTPGYLAFHPQPSKPDSPLPAGSCDSHCHVFGPAADFPFSPTSTYQPVDAPRDTLFQRHRFLGIDRAVVVQASCHGTDNSAMLDAIASNPDNYRGVAVVDADIEEAELHRMHQLGVRGVRFNFVKRLGGGQPLSVYRSILARILPLNWHVIVYFDSEDLEEIEPFLREIRVPVVIDHMGRVPVEEGVSSRAYRLLSNLLNSDDNFWTKISCPERLSKTGPPYDDVDEVAIDLLENWPDRILWGTDWPHPNMKSHMPDDGQLVNRFMAICPDDDLRKKVLIQNPDKLYFSD